MVRVHPCLPTSASRAQQRQLSAGCALSGRAESRELVTHPPMSQITVTLPDGSSRSVPAGAPVRDVAEGISPRLAKAALAGVVDGKLVDLSYPLERDAVGPDRDRPEPRGAAALPAQHRASAGGRRDEPVSRRAVRHRSRRPTKASSTTSSSTRPFVPEDLEAIEQKMQELASQDLVYERQMWPRDEAQGVLRAARRAAQGAADRREDRRPGARSPATRSRTGRRSSTSASARTCRRPAS